MAKDAKAPESGAEEDAVKGGALQTTAAAGLPAALGDLAAEATGAGVSRSADDSIVPFIALLQDNSPEVKKRDPKYVEGAEAGDLLNKSVSKLYKGSTGFVAIPVHMVRCINQWIPRDDGGGFVARHPFIDSVEESVRRIGGVQMKDPKDPDKVIWRTADRKHDLIDTRYHYILIEDGARLIPVNIAFSSTGHTVSRQWMSLMKEPLPGSVTTPDAWMRRYRVTSVPKKNKKGDFFIIKAAYVQDEKNPYAEYVMEKEKRQFARDFFEAIQSGRVSAEVDDNSGGDDTGGKGDGSQI